MEEISKLFLSIGFVKHFTQSKTSCFLLLFPVSFCKVFSSSQAIRGHSWLVCLAQFTFTDF